MGHQISMEQLKVDVGHMVEKMTEITIMFRRIKLKMEEYVCLKVYILLNNGKFIHKYYMLYISDENRKCCVVLLCILILFSAYI